MIVGFASCEGLKFIFVLNRGVLNPTSDLSILSWLPLDGAGMSNLGEDEEEGDISFNEEKLVVQSKMDTLVQSLVSSIDQRDSIGQLLLKKPKNELCQQTWEDRIRIKMCLRILEQVVVM